MKFSSFVFLLIALVFHYIRTHVMELNAGKNYVLDIEGVKYNSDFKYDFNDMKNKLACTNDLIKKSLASDAKVDGNATAEEKLEFEKNKELQKQMRSIFGNMDIIDKYKNDITFKFSKIVFFKPSLNAPNDKGEAEVYKSLKFIVKNPKELEWKETESFANEKFMVTNLGYEGNKNCEGFIANLVSNQRSNDLVTMTGPNPSCKFDSEKSLDSSEEFQKVKNKIHESLAKTDSNGQVKTKEILENEAIEQARSYFKDLYKNVLVGFIGWSDEFSKDVDTINETIKKLNKEKSQKENDRLDVEGKPKSKPNEEAIERINNEINQIEKKIEEEKQKFKTYRGYIFVIGMSECPQQRIIIL